MKKNDTKEVARKPTMEERQALLRKVDYNASVTGAVFASDLKRVVGEDVTATGLAAPYARDLIERFQPRDAVEEMLVSQMIVTHGRLLHLNTSAGHQTNLKWAQLMNDAADRASNTFRRLVLALADYRNPRRGSSFTAIGQANIAQQQIVNPPAQTPSSVSGGATAAPALDGPAAKPDVADPPVSQAEPRVHEAK